MRIVGGIVLFTLAACASAPQKPLQPYMSVAGHESSAEQHEQAARANEHRYSPHARESGGMCRGKPRGNAGDDVCWTSMMNPTEQYLKHAKEHHRLAAEHRVAARTLRDAEARACTGVSDEDRDESPFDHREDILRVEPLHGGVSRYLNEPWTEGVVVIFRPVPGMSVTWLQHVIDCQLARNAALGNDVPQMPNCLLVPKGVRAAVTQVPDGFAVTIRAGDKETAEELFRRADALTLPIKQAPADGPGTPPAEPPSAPN